MSFWTLYLDVAGTIDRDTSKSDRVTISCVAIPTVEEADTRARIGISVPKWRDTDANTLETIMRVLAEKSVYANALQIRKTEPMWSAFWTDGLKHQERLLTLAESTSGDSKQNRGLRFIRPANILKYSLFCRGSADLLASCVKYKKLSPIVDAKGYQRLDLRVICDTDINGVENQEALEHIWQIWSKATEIRNRLKILPTVHSVEFKTEQELPILLLPDYIAGLFHSLSSPHVQIPEGVDENQAQMIAQRTMDEHRFSFESVDFDLEFPELIQELEILN